MSSSSLSDTKQAASYLKVTVEQIRGFVDDGELIFINVGRGKKRPRMRFAQEDLDRFIDSRRQKSNPPCLSTKRKNRRITNMTSKSPVIGFTALRNAHLEKKQKGSK